MYCEKVTSCCAFSRKEQLIRIKKGIKQEILHFTPINILNK